MRLWREINEHYMTEETESEGGENIRRHKLPWRSQGTHKYMHAWLIIISSRL